MNPVYRQVIPQNKGQILFSSNFHKINRLNILYKLTKLVKIAVFILRFDYDNNDATPRL